MDSIRAFAMGEAHRDNPLRVFDWDKAADLIRERRPARASAGLSGDWDWTGGEIWNGESPTPRTETYTYLASTWAHPEIDLDGDVEDCWKWQDETPGWDSGTYWPPSAVERLTSRVSR